MTVTRRLVAHSTCVWTCAALLLLAGCTYSDSAGSAEQSAPAASASASPSEAVTTGPAIVVEDSGSEGASDGGASAKGTDAQPQPQPKGVAITPGGLDLSALPSTCTDEGMILIPKGGTPDKPLAGNPGTLTYKGWTQGEGATSTATFTFDSSSGPEDFGPVKLGDTFVLGDTTYSVTSICEEAAELDQVGQG